MMCADVENKTVVTLKGEGTARFEEKRSVFIGYAIPISSEDEALSYVKKIKGQYPDATHCVYAYYLDNGIHCRYSDDGEPQGTAGMPVLDVIRKNGLTDVCAVVVRYFGGTLLGAGGLVRAYGEACKLALDAAGSAIFVPFVIAEFSCSYSDYGKLSVSFPAYAARTLDVAYADVVTVAVTMPKDRYGSFADAVREMTGGRTALRISGERLDCEQ